MTILCDLRAGDGNTVLTEFGVRTSGGTMVVISVMDTQFSAYPKCLDSLFIYLPGMAISTGNPQFLKHGSIEE